MLKGNELQGYKITHISTDDYTAYNPLRVDAYLNDLDERVDTNLYNDTWQELHDSRNFRSGIANAQLELDNVSPSIAIELHHRMEDLQDAINQVSYALQQTNRLYTDKAKLKEKVEAEAEAKHNRNLDIIKRANAELGERTS